MTESHGTEADFAPVLRGELVRDISGTLHLVDRLDRLRSLTQDFVRGIEQITGHPSSWMRILAEIRAGRSHPRHIARAAGMDPKSVGTALEAMADEGLVTLRRDERGRLAGAVVADAGATALAQAQSLEIHLTDAFVEQLGQARTAQALEVVESIIAVMDGSALPAGETGDTAEPRELE